MTDETLCGKTQQPHRFVKTAPQPGLEEGKPAENFDVYICQDCGVERRTKHDCLLESVPAKVSDSGINLDNPDHYHMLSRSHINILNARRFGLNYQEFPKLTPEQEEERDALNRWWRKYRSWLSQQKER